MLVLKWTKIAIVEYIIILHIGHSNFKMTFVYTDFKTNDYCCKQCVCNKHKNNCIFYIQKLYKQL